MANRYSQAPSHGGAFRSGEPHLIVIHSLEAPARRGLAWDLANGWIKTAGVSPHSMTDPGETVDLLDLNTVGWHCGNGNQYSIGLEVTGYAAWSTADWTTGDAFEALKLDAKRATEVARAKNIPMRWLSLAQIRAGERGFCTHADISATYAGTNHTDPGRGFPYALFMQLVQQYAGGVVNPSLNPNPQPGDGPGGAQPRDWWNEMSDSEKAQLLADVAEIKKRLRGSEPTIDSLQALAMGLDAANRQITTLSGAVQDVQDRVRGPKDRPWDQFQELGRRIDGLSPKA